MTTKIPKFRHACDSSSSRSISLHPSRPHSAQTTCQLGSTFGFGSRPFAPRCFPPVPYPPPVLGNFGTSSSNVALLLLRLLLSRLNVVEPSSLWLEPQAGAGRFRRHFGSPISSLISDTDHSGTCRSGAPSPGPSAISLAPAPRVGSDASRRAGTQRRIYDGVVAPLG